MRIRLEDPESYVKSESLGRTTTPDSQRAPAVLTQQSSPSASDKSAEPLEDWSREQATRAFLNSSQSQT